MLKLGLISVLKEKASETFRVGSWGYLFAVAVEGLLFIISLKLETESEVVFTLVYVLSAVLISIFIGSGPGFLAGILASLSVDFHYIHPLGKVLAKWESVIFLALVFFIVQGTLIGVKLLRDALREAQLGSRAREEMLAIIAHDLRQPLTVVSLRQHALLKSLQVGDLPTAMRLVQESRKTFDHMDRMIQSLLEAAKFASLNFALSRREASLEELARQVLENFVPIARKKGVRLVLEPVTEPCPQVSIDVHGIERVFSNLLNNAIKFTPEGGSVVLQILREPGAVGVAVQDSGVGVSKENRSKLFKRNWQSHETAHLGNGLGLFICEKIVTAHQGKIWYEAAPHRGATFRFNVPMTDSRVHGS